MKLKPEKLLTKKDIRIFELKIAIGLRNFNQKVNIVSAGTFKKNDYEN